MKYKFKAFIAPFLMILAYASAQYIFNDGYGCGVAYCDKISLINFGGILGTEGFNLMIIFILVIIPGIFILLTLINLFLGFKTIRLNRKFKLTTNQYYLEKTQKTVLAIRGNTRIFFIFFVLVFVLKVLVVLEKDNPEHTNTYDCAPIYDPNTQTFVPPPGC